MLCYSISTEWNKLLMARFKQLFLVSLIVFIELFANANAGTCWTATIQSAGQFANPNFVWALGIPSIDVQFTIKFAISYYNRDSIGLYSNNSDQLALFRYGSLYSYDSTFNMSVFNNGTTSIINMTIVRPEMFNGKFVNVKQYYGSYCRQSNSYETPVISLKGCDQPNKLNIISPKLSENWVYGTKATAQCDGSLFESRPKIFHRHEIFTCGATAEWNGLRFNCFDGAIIDLNNAVGEVTFDTNTTVLLFCDRFDANMHLVTISFDNMTWSNESMTWAEVVVTPVHHLSSVTCYQMSKNNDQSASRKVKMNVKFPPVIHANMTVNWGLYLRKQGMAEIRFKSNPPLSESSKIFAYKDGVEVKNVHYTSQNIINVVVLYFTNVSETDFGLYEITINSGSPFYTINNISVNVYKKEANETVHLGTQNNVSLPVPAIVLGSSTILFFTITVVLVVKINRIGCFNSTSETCNFAMKRPTTVQAVNLNAQACPKQNKQSVPPKSPVNPYIQRTPIVSEDYVDPDQCTNYHDDTIYESF